MRKIREIRNLIVRLSILAVLGVVAYFAYKWFFAPAEEEEIVLEETPLKVEQIRSILELNTLKFQDEVVADSVEFYTSSGDFISGTLEKLTSADQFKNGISGSGIKRRLTLIVRGELTYGSDLKRKDFQLIPGKDTLEIRVPAPELLSVSISPKKTELITENGFWKDYELVDLERKAKQKMVKSGERMKLSERAKVPLEACLKSLVKSSKVVVVHFID